MANIPVKWAHSGMRGAPVINGTVGTLISALRAFLITGFAPTAAVSATVLDGIATIMLPSGQSFEEHAVVQLGGATTAGFNGEERVITTASDRITVATSAPNGPVAGSITVRYAPVGGWEEVFTKTNVSVFRSTDATGSRMFLRVDDSAATLARVTGYETMTDVDTGTGAFPTATQVSGGGYWHKAMSANATAVKWRMVGDSRFFLHAISTGNSSSLTSVATSCRGFGDPISLAAGGDPWGCVLAVAGSASATLRGGLESVDAASVSNGGIYCARPASAIGGSQMMNSRPFTGSASSYSGADTYLGDGPSSHDGQLKPSKMFIYAQGTAQPPRSITPGVLYFPQSSLLNILSDGDYLMGEGELAGQRLMVIYIGGQPASTGGCCAVNLTSFGR